MSAKWNAKTLTPQLSKVIHFLCLISFELHALSRSLSPILNTFNLCAFNMAVQPKREGIPWVEIEIEESCLLRSFYSNRSFEEYMYVSTFILICFILVIG